MGWFARKKTAVRTGLRLPTSPTFSQEAREAERELCHAIGRLCATGAARFRVSATLRPTLEESLDASPVEDLVGSAMLEVLSTPYAWALHALRSRLDTLGGVDSDATVERALGESAATYNRVVEQLRTAPTDVFSDEDWTRLRIAHEQILDLFTAAQASVARSVDLAMFIQDRWRVLDRLPADTHASSLADDLRQQAELALEELATHRAALRQHLPACVGAAQARQAQWLAVRATLGTRQALSDAVQLSTASLGQEQALDSVAELAALSSLVEQHVVGDLQEAQAEIIRQQQLQQALKAQARRLP